MEVIAHRGIHNAHVKENTIEAIKAVETSKADGIEIDVRITADDICVVHHNTKIVSGHRLAKQNYADLKQYDPDLLRVSEALEVLNGFDGLINLEVKHILGERDRYRGIACVDKLTQDLEAQNAKNLLISSFSLPNMKRISGTIPHISRAYLLPFGVSFTKGLDRASRYGCEAIHISVAQMFKTRAIDFVNKAHQNDLKVRVYTVNSPREFERAEILKIDGIFTDYVDSFI